MITKFAHAWQAAETETKALWTASIPDDYDKIVQRIRKVLHGVEPCMAEIETAMFGDYQGEYVVLFGKYSARWFARVEYGSCSGCDTLQAIFADASDNTEQTVTDLFAYATHIVQSIKELP